MRAELSCFDPPVGCGSGERLSPVDVVSL